MDALDRIDGRLVDAAELRARLRKGDRCFAVRIDGRIASFLWCALARCEYPPYRFPLAPNEAYAYDAHTLRSFRGRALAGLVRREAFNRLRAEGRDLLYSITERTNTPAVRHKRKLNVPPQRLYLYLRFFNWFERRWTVRNHQRQTPDPARRNLKESESMS